MLKDWRKKRSVIKRYDITASIYDARYKEEQATKIKTALNHLRIKTHSRVLDAGCGTGLLFEYMPTDAEMIVGIDFSRKTLAEARRLGKIPNTILVMADADNLPFSSGTFDYVFAITLLQNCPEPDKTIDELARVLKHTGEMIVTALKKIFERKGFEYILAGANLRCIILDEPEEGLKCWVAACKPA